MTVDKRLLNHPLVEMVSDERDCGGEWPGDGIWCYLKPGHVWEDVHCVHEWNTKDCLDALKQVEECRCEQCLMEMEELAERNS